MSSYLSFESDRLYLRPTTEEDAALVLAILTAPKALKFIGDRNLHNEEDAREYIRQRALCTTARARICELHPCDQRNGNQGWGLWIVRASRFGAH